MAGGTLKAVGENPPTSSSPPSPVPSTSSLPPTGTAKKVSPSDIQLVQNMIEKCLQVYMPKEEVVNTLQNKANIPRQFTSLVWQQLEQENPEFFWAYYLRLKVKDQISLFNYLQEQGRMQKLQERFMQAMPGAAVMPRPNLAIPSMSQLNAVQPRPMGWIQDFNQLQMQMPPNVQVSVPVVDNALPVPTVENPATPQDPPLAHTEPVASQPSHSFELPPLNVPSTSQALSATNGGANASGGALSSPHDLGFNSNLFATCPSPELGGTSNDLLLSGGGLPMGGGSSNDLQSLVQNFSYPDLSSLDVHGSSFMGGDGDGLGGQGMLDLPRISSLSDMTPLDLEQLDK